MRRALMVALTTAAIGFASIPAPAGAAVLVADGITYNLTLDSVSGNTGYFTLAISGINTASDTEGGRTGINAFAFTDPTVGTVLSGASTGFTFMIGGLNSSGCDGNGGFFCFANSGYNPGSPLPSSLSLDFNVTSNTAGSWTSWTPDFKIDWVGSQNNYDLVSQPIPVNGVPEPATWGLMLLGFVGIGIEIRRRRKAMLMQIA